MTRKEKLIDEGWEPRSTQDEPRLSELKTEYEALGFQVHLEPFDPLEEPGCAECMKAAPDRYWTIYTRKKPADTLR